MNNQTVKPELKSPEMKAARVAIVNEIIKEIASRGRKFFYNDKTGAVAYLHMVNNRIYYKCESVYYGKTDLCFSVAPGHMKGWYHGGTLKALMHDFCDYIKTGGDTNHNNGYGGLYCPHWGYSTEDMKAIQDKAVELGYLLPRKGGSGE